MSLLTLGGLTLDPVETEFSPATESIFRRRATSSVQKRAEELWENYGGVIGPMAEESAVPVEAALTVFLVEAGGRSHNSETGLCIIRFEPHIFRRFTKTAVSIRRGGQGREWEALQRASDINLSAALKSTSWGLPQLMGFNWRVTDYPTVNEMVSAFQRSSTEQIKGFFGFLHANNLIRPVQQQNWELVALRYNGRGNIPHYSKALEATFSQVSQMTKG